MLEAAPHARHGFAVRQTDRIQVQVEVAHASLETLRHLRMGKQIKYNRGETYLNYKDT